MVCRHSGRRKPCDLRITDREGVRMIFLLRSRRHRTDRWLLRSLAVAHHHVDLGADCALVELRALPRICRRRTGKVARSSFASFRSSDVDRSVMVRRHPAAPRRIRHICRGSRSSRPGDRGEPLSEANAVCFKGERVRSPWSTKVTVTKVSRSTSPCASSVVGEDQPLRRDDLTIDTVLDHDGAVGSTHAAMPSAAGAQVDGTGERDEIARRPPARRQAFVGPRREHARPRAAMSRVTTSSRAIGGRRYSWRPTDIHGVLTNSTSATISIDGPSSGGRPNRQDRLWCGR